MKPGHKESSLKTTKKGNVTINPKKEDLMSEHLRSRVLSSVEALKEAAKKKNKNIKAARAGNRWQDSDGDGKWYEPGQDVKKEEAEVYWSSKALDQLEEAQSKTLNVEGLKGGQHKIDANKNGKIAAHDFAMLRGRKGKKSMKEMWQLAAEAKAKIEIMPEIDDRDPGNVKKKNEKKVGEESSCGSSKKAKKY